MPKSQVSINVHDLLGMTGSMLSNVDYDKMSEIAEAVSRNPALINDFDCDSAGTAKRINGFVAPSGFHMHVVDANNVYHPRENDPLAQISTKAVNATWTRVETRAGFGAFACIICLWCS